MNYIFWVIISLFLVVETAHSDEAGAIDQALASFFSVARVTAARQQLVTEVRAAYRAGLSDCPMMPTIPTPTAIPQPTATPLPIPTPTATIPLPPKLMPIPGLIQWQANMLKFGRMNCDLLVDPAIIFDLKLVSVYYDAERVFYQMADYTGNAAWADCAQAAERIYRDKWALPGKGFVQGYQNFSTGLRMDAQKTGDLISRDTVLLLAKNAAFARDSTPLDKTTDSTLSREVAYAILSYLDAEQLSEPRRERLTVLVDQAFGHLDQWTGATTAPFVKPFMVGLTAEALIRYHETTPDTRTVNALALAAEWLWVNLWDAPSQTFRYANNAAAGGIWNNPSPDLNLLIAPMFAWLWKETGDFAFLERGDKIFAGGVKGAFLKRGKQFNQSYRWSFDYVKWRGF